jgi:Ca-activated chloride channel family protein
LTDELEKIRTLIATSLAVFLVATATACGFPLTTDAAGANDIDTDTDTDTDTGDDAEHHPPESDTEDADCDTENLAEFDLAPADSNSMAGPAMARFLINRGQKVTGAIRIQEFLNYYDFEYASPESGPVGIGAQMSAPGEDGTYDLQVGVRAGDQSPTDRRPFNVTLCIDTSESMAGTAIQRVKQSCVSLANSLRAGDVVSLVTWDAVQDVALQSHAVQSSGDPTLIGLCNALTANGSDDLSSGLIKAYSLASLNFDPSRINRVVLISDGGTSATAADKQLIAQHADDAAGEAIYLMGVGVGDDDSPDHYSDSLMKTVTAAGKGAHIFIDSAEEATAMFGDRLVPNVEIAARDVRLELSLPPTFELVAPEYDEHSDTPSDPDPQHLSPADTMVFQLSARSCDSTVPTPDDPVVVVATYEDPITREPGEVELSTTLGELLEQDAALLLKGSAVVAYAEALTRLQTLDGQSALDAIEATRATVQVAADSLTDDPDLAEIDQLLASYALLF